MLVFGDVWPWQEKLVDTNGAGDAFVGGFLAALAKGKDMEVRSAGKLVGYRRIEGSCGLLVGVSWSFFGDFGSSFFFGYDV